MAQFIDFFVAVQVASIIHPPLMSILPLFLLHFTEEHKIPLFAIGGPVWSTNCYLCKMTALIAIPASLAARFPYCVCNELDRLSIFHIDKNSWDSSIICFRIVSLSESSASAMERIDESTAHRVYKGGCSSAIAVVLKLWPSKSLISESTCIAKVTMLRSWPRNIPETRFSNI